jgi:hypothetical protein
VDERYRAYEQAECDVKNVQELLTLISKVLVCYNAYAMLHYGMAPTAAKAVEAVVDDASEVVRSIERVVDRRFNHSVDGCEVSRAYHAAAVSVLALMTVNQRVLFQLGMEKRVEEMRA